MKPQPVTWIDGPPPPEAIAAFEALFGVTICPPGRAHGLDDEGDPEPTGRVRAEARSNRPGRRREDGVARTASGRKSRSRRAVAVDGVLAEHSGRQRVADLAALGVLQQHEIETVALSPACGHALGRLALLGAVTARQWAAGEALARAWRSVAGGNGTGFPSRAQIAPQEGDPGRQIGLADADDIASPVDDEQEAPTMGRRAARRVLIETEAAIIAALGLPAWNLTQAVALGIGQTPRCATLRLLRRALDVADSAMNPRAYGPGLCDDDTDGDEMQLHHRSTRSGAGGSAGAHV